MNIFYYFWKHETYYEKIVRYLKLISFKIYIIMLFSFIFIFMLYLYLNKNETKHKQKNKHNKHNRYKKASIPKALRRSVWNKYIGVTVGQALCPCCKVTKIDQQNFECGHVKAEAKGGLTNLSNLKPICGSCNKSMGTKNMNEFIKIYGF